MAGINGELHEGEMESFDKPRLSQQILEIEDVDIPETMPTTATFLYSWLCLRAIPADIPSPETFVAQIMRQDAAEGFQLDSGLLRVLLFGLDDKIFFLYFNVHHAAFDAHSQALLESELQCELAGDVIHAADVQYADYALWQRKWLEQGESQRCLKYWRRKLEGGKLSLDLPEPPLKSSATPGLVTSQWPLHLLGDLRAVAQRQKSSEMALLLSLFGILLSRNFGQDDLLVGIPEAGRGDPRLQKIIGFFVNTLPIRLSFRQEVMPSFADLLRRTQESLFEAIDHSAIPFQHLVAEMRQEIKGHQQSPLLQAFFQHVVAGFNLPSKPAVGVSFEHFDFKPSPAPAKFEVSLQTSSSSDGLNLRWEFMPEILSYTTVRLLDRQLLKMAQRLVMEGADIPLGRLGDEPLDQRHVVLHDWSTSYSLPLPECRIEDIFKQQAIRTPRQTALILGEEMISYRKLLEASQDFAEVLISERPDLPFVVALLCDRSFEMLVALLSTLMAGASFVPISPELPLERIRFMITEAKVVLLVTKSTGSNFASCLPLPCIFIPSMGHFRENLPSSKSRNIAKGVKPEVAAYIIFTSGSTGKPKGVTLSHRALLSHLIPYIQVLRLGSSTSTERVLLTSSFTFDMAYSQIFGALLSGSCLVITKENPMIDPLELLEILQQQTISFTTLVPSVLSSMVHLKKTSFALPALRHLGCGGEALKAAAADFWRSCTSAVDTLLLHNRYGPTECAINALLFGPGMMHTDDTEDQNDVPIGWPSCHRHISIDSRIDAPGELILAGEGIALGYVGSKPEPIASFQDNLRGAGQDYHTGDLVSRCFRNGTSGNGCVRFIGRRDSQVKLLGQRIDLSEIEATIGNLSEVDACVVVTSRSQNLTAFISPDRADLLEIVGSQCEKLLPKAMIPQFHLLKMESWPRTTSGKIDRVALGELASQTLTADDDDLHSEANALEANQVGAVAILMEVLGDLGLSDLSPSSSLSSLGLSSLLALRISTKCARRGAQISIRGLLAPNATVSTAAQSKGQMDPIQEALDVLLGSPHLVLRDIGVGDATWEVLICPGDGGLGAEGYRPLASKLSAKACRILVADGLLSLKTRSLKTMAEEVLKRWPRQKPRVLLGHSWGAALAVQLASLEPVEAVWLLDPSKHHFCQAEEQSKETSISELLELLARLCHGEVALKLKELPPPQDGDLVALQKVLGASYQRFLRAAESRSRNLSLKLEDACVTSKLHVVLASDMQTTPTARLSDVETMLSGISVNWSIAWSPGDHYSMLEPSNCDDVASALLRSLEPA